MEHYATSLQHILAEQERIDFIINSGPFQTLDHLRKTEFWCQLHLYYESLYVYKLARSHDY